MLYGYQMSLRAFFVLVIFSSTLLLPQWASAERVCQQENAHACEHDNSVMHDCCDDLLRVHCTGLSIAYVECDASIETPVTVLAESAKSRAVTETRPKHGSELFRPPIYTKLYC